jgi:hypothetical protein
MQAAQFASLLRLAIARGVVDQDVDAAERGGRGRDVARHIRAVGEIANADRGMDAATASGDLSGILERLGAAGADGTAAARPRRIPARWIGRCRGWHR